MIATVLIRAVALNRLPKTTFIVLWGMALSRLLIPVGIPARFSIFTALEGLTNFITPNNVISQSMSYSGVLTSRIPLPMMALSASEATGQTGSISAITILWLTGIAIVMACIIFIYIVNYRVLRCATPIRDNDFLDEWIAEHKLLRPISIMQSEKITTPLAAGLFKPRIVLPKCMNIGDKPLLSYVLMHEYYHIKRLDALWKILLVCAVCIHWFNPLVWVMFVLANRDLELTCDELVIRRFGTETRTAYAYAIISMAEHNCNYASLHSGFSKNSANERINERIESIMKIKKSSLMCIILAFFLVTALAIGTLSVFAIDNQPHDEATEITFEDFIRSRYTHEELMARAQDAPIYHSIHAICAATGESIAIMNDDEFITWREENAANIFCGAPGSCTSPFCPSNYGEEHYLPSLPSLADLPYLYGLLNAGTPFIPNTELCPYILDALGLSERP